MASRLARSPLEGLVGNTPLLPLPQFSPRKGVEILAKAEWFNPGGSVKDRPALAIVRAGEQARRLRPGMTLVDATSGNTGIAYAMFGAAKGFRVRLFLPSSASPERKRILGAFGAVAFPLTIVNLAAIGVLSTTSGESPTGSFAAASEASRRRNPT